MREMSKRERVMRTINFQETDRIAVYDLIDSDVIREYYGGGRIHMESGQALCGRISENNPEP